MKNQSKSPFKRAERVGDMIARELALAMLERVSDPRIRRCTVTAVSVSDDLKSAKVFFSMISREAGEIRQTLKALEKAEGFFKKVIGDNLKLRYTPTLRFIHDGSLERGSQMLNLINKVTAEDEPNDPED